MNIEEVRESLQTALICKEQVGICTDDAQEYIDHVSYLLSVIEQADKAFEEIQDITDGVNVPPENIIDKIVVEALQAIRK